MSSIVDRWPDNKDLFRHIKENRLCVTLAPFSFYVLHIYDNYAPLVL